MLLRVLLLVCLSIFVSIPDASAQALGDVTLEERSAGIETRRERLAEIEGLLSETEDTAELLSLRDEARALRREADAAVQPLLTRKNELARELEALGAPPDEGEVEAPEITQRRTAISRRAAEIDALIAQTELNRTVATRITETVAEMRREAFTGQLSRQGPSLLSPGLWREATSTGLTSTGRFVDAARAWVNSHVVPGGGGDRGLLVIGAILLAILLFVPVRRAIDRIIKNKIKPLDPLPSRRVLAAAVRSLGSVVPDVLGGFVIYEALKAAGAVPDNAEPLARAIWFGFVILTLTTGTIKAIFAPRLPSWRVAPMESGKVSTVRVIALLAALALVLEPVTERFVELFGGSAAFLYLYEGATGLVLGVLLLLLSRKSLWCAAPEEGEDAGPAPAEPATEGEPHERRLWPRLRLTGTLLALAAILGPLFGYVDLGHYIGTRTFHLIALFGAAWALRALIREIVRLFDHGFTSQTRKEAGSAGPEDGQRLLYSWIGLVIDITVIAAVIAPALLILGAAWTDVRGWMTDALLGFNVGNVRISLARVLGAFLTFVVILWVTRFIQRTADRQIFPRSRIDRGVQNSLRTLIGYVGLIIAFLAGVGSIGFDLGNLAIIAGALSVGIGFGLQSIVSNFVSGLILLFERPIKVGDWVQTTSGEGTVKRISVRSTEIETFDRSSVIVPNSELISNSVTNLTHKDNMGRVVIAVGVAYSSDAQGVIGILEDVAKNSPEVLRFPKPIVVFEDFGASSLDFTLRVYIREVSDTLSVRTKIRVRIHERFKKEGVEIPFPQQDLYLRGVPEGWEQLSPARRREPSAEG
jgi:small-conductance mechanosensitive channel